MTFFTKNILKYYQYNEHTSFYLDKHFIDTNVLGYHKPFSKSPFLKSPDGREYIGTIDEYNTYEMNALGFRGQVYEDANILGVGCSITYGIGVPELARWTNILGNKLNTNVMNLGNPGASVESICSTIIQYCLNSKMPKKVFCLMPDFFRSMVVVDSEFYKSKRHQNLENKNVLYTIYNNPTIKKKKDYVFMEVEDQTYIEDSTSPHQRILNSVNSVYMLEAFCLSNNIDLYWTTWDIPTACVMDELLKIKDFKLKKYKNILLPNQLESLNDMINNECNLDHGSEFINDLCWKAGSDYSVINYKKITTRAHPGIHFQQHVADFFYDMSMVKNENY